MKKSIFIYLSLFLALSLSAKAVNIISPQPGEVIPTGSVYYIKWEKEHGMLYDVLVAYDGTFYYRLAKNLDSDNFNWQVTQDAHLGSKVRIDSKESDIFELFKKLDYGINSEARSVKIYSRNNEIEVLGAFKSGEIIIKDTAGNTIWEFMPSFSSMVLFDADITPGKDTIAASFYFSENSEDKYGVMLIDRASKNFRIFGSDIIKEDIQSVAIHPGDSRLLAGCYDGKAYLYDFEGNLINTYATNDNAEIYHVSFSNDGTKAVYTSGTGHSYVVDYPDGGNKKMFSKHGVHNYQSVVWSAEISGDNDFVLTAGIDGTFRKWDMETRNEIIRIHPTKTHIRTVNMTNNGKYIIVGALDNTVRVFEQFEPTIEHTGKTEHQVLTTDVYHEGNTYYIAAGLRDGGINIWRLVEGISGTKSIDIDLKHFVEIDLPEEVVRSGDNFEYVPEISSQNPKAISALADNLDNLVLKVPYLSVDLPGYEEHEILDNYLIGTYKVEGIPMQLEGRALRGNNSKDTVILEAMSFLNPDDTTKYVLTQEGGSITVISPCLEVEYGILVHPDADNRLQVAPNPAENELGVMLNIIEEADYRLYLTDMQGNKIKEFLDRELIENKYNLKFSLNDISSGNYFLILEYRGRKAEKKISVVK